MRKVRPIPPRLLPHLNLLQIEPALPGGPGKRTYGPKATIKRSLIIDGSLVTKSRYDQQTGPRGTVYFERTATQDLPPIESKVTLWVGTPDERVAHVHEVNKYHDDRIGSLVEVHLK